MAFCGTHPKKKDFSGENTWVEGCVVFSVKRLPSSTWLERLLPPAQELDTLLAGSPLRNMSGTNTHFFGTKPKTLISRFEVCFFPHLGGLNNGISVRLLFFVCLFCWGLTSFRIRWNRSFMIFRRAADCASWMGLIWKYKEFYNWDRLVCEKPQVMANLEWYIIYCMNIIYHLGLKSYQLVPFAGVLCPI